MKSLSLVVSEKNIFLGFPILNQWELMTPGSGPFLTLEGMVGRTYKEEHYTLLNTKHESPGPCGFREEGFLCFSYDAPGAGSVWTPGARLAGFINRTTIHCYTQNMKALGHVASDKNIFIVSL